MFYYLIAYLFQCLNAHFETSFQIDVLELCRLCHESFINHIELVLHTFTTFCSKVNQLISLLVSHLTIRIDKFHHARESLADSKMVTL